MEQLIRRDDPGTAEEDWRDWWDALGRDRIGPGEIGAVLASLSTALPADPVLVGFVASLRPDTAVLRPRPGSVNVVGTGGGPPTFNFSTGAALVAAALGVPVIKTGSRAYTSALGSLDLLDALGVPLTSRAEEIDERLASGGPAFAGTHVYPRELVAMARRIHPLPMRLFGGFLNLVGPFLGDVPVEAQVTGVSAPELVPRALALRAARPERRIWIVENDLGIDELVPFADSVIHLPGGESVVVPAAGVAQADLGPLRPDPDRDPVEQFVELVSGRGPEPAVEMLALNAAALAVAGGHAPSWWRAMADARSAIGSGAAADLLERLRTRPRAHGPTIAGAAR